MLHFFTSNYLYIKTHQQIPIDHLLDIQAQFTLAIVVCPSHNFHILAKYNSPQITMSSQISSMISVLRQAFPGKARFTERHLQDLTGKVSVPELARWESRTNSIIRSSLLRVRTLALARSW